MFEYDLYSSGGVSDSLTVKYICVNLGLSASGVHFFVLSVVAMYFHSCIKIHFVQGFILQAGFVLIDWYLSVA